LIHLQYQIVENIQGKLTNGSSKTPCRTSRFKDHASDRCNSVPENWNVNEAEGDKVQIKNKNRILSELTSSVNALAKKKGKLRSEIEHLLLCKNSFFEGLTKIRKLMLSQKQGSILQYYPVNNTGLVLYECERELRTDEGQILQSVLSVPPVKHESDLKGDK
jgi:hypothetical protein